MTLLYRSIFVFLSIVALIEIVFGITYHSNLLQLALAGSLLGAISLCEKIVKFRDNGAALLFRVASQVVFVAMLFINLSHCFEELTDFGHEHNETKEAPEKPTESTNETTGHLHSTQQMFLISIGDFFIKTMLCLLVKPTVLGSTLKSMLILLTPSLSMMLIHSILMEQEKIHGGWILGHIEPLLAITLTLLSYAFVIPSILHLKPYLLADSPPLDQFDITKLEKEVKLKVPCLDNVSHVHASREWPEGFKVTMKAELRISKTDPQWVTKAAQSFESCKSLLHTLIKNAGANTVVVEPVFIDPNDTSDERNSAICIDKSCHSKDVGCCTVRKDEIEEVNAENV